MPAASVCFFTDEAWEARRRCRWYRGTLPMWAATVAQAAQKNKALKVRALLRAYLAERGGFEPPIGY